MSRLVRLARARVATLRWLNSLKRMRRGLCTNAPYHKISDISGKSVHRPWSLAVQYCFAVNSAVGRSGEGQGKTFCPLLSPSLLVLATQGVKGLAFAFGKNVCLFDVM